MDLTTDDLPALFSDADRTSLEGQHQYTRGTALRLGAVTVAAVAALSSESVVVGRLEVFGLVAAVCFVIALAVEVWLMADRPERDWYGGRFLAESAKTLAWRYAVGGAPFAIADADASKRLREELAALLDDAPEINIVPRRAEAAIVTDAMTKLRAASSDDRRMSYIRFRIVDQQAWYATKAEYNIRRAKQWKLALIGAEFVGVVLALLKAFGYLHVDLASVTSAAIASGAAWLGMKQHESLSRSYTLAGHELALIASRLQEVTDEEEWALEVADAEEAISREHTMWRAARLAEGGSRVRLRLNSHGDHPGVTHAASERRTNNDSYISQIAEQIRSRAGDVEPSRDLLYLTYAVLARAKGQLVTAEDVHDAWSAVRELESPSDPDVIPYDRLSAEVRERDERYAEIIRVVAAAGSTGARIRPGGVQEARAIETE